MQELLILNLKSQVTSMRSSDIYFIKKNLKYTHAVIAVNMVAGIKKEGGVQIVTLLSIEHIATNYVEDANTMKFMLEINLLYRLKG